jgi:hypothetical protein
MKDLYDLSPEARYKEIEDEGLYYLNHYSYGRISIILDTLMALDKHVEMEECLFRLKHILGSGEAPRDLYEAHKIKQIAPRIYFFDHWLRVRLETDPEKRKVEGWAAVYWLIEDLLRNTGNVFGMGRWFHKLCAIKAEAELWEDEKDKTEFMRYLKLHAMNGGIGTCRKLMADPTPLVTPKEMGFPSSEECRRIYAEVAAEVAAEMEKSPPMKKRKK